MGQKIIQSILYFLVSVLSQQVKYTDLKSIKSVSVQLDDTILNGWANQVLQVNFNPEVYDIFSISLKQIFPDGTSKEEQELDNESVFQTRDFSNLGGCRTFQSKAYMFPIFKTTTNFKESSLYERFQDVLQFPDLKKFYIITNTFKVFQLYYSQSSQDRIDNANLNYDPQSNFFDTLQIPKDTIPPEVVDIVAKTSAIQYKEYGYIFCRFGAVKFKTSPQNVLGKSEFILQQDFAKRSEVYSVTIDYNNYVYAATSEGIDIYTISPTSDLKLFKSLKTALLKTYSKTFPMDIRKVQLVKQDDIDVVLLMENEFGIHVLQNINYSAEWVYKYFILLRKIQNFDATGYTIAAALNTKNFQFGVEIFFDHKQYYINQLQDDELEVTGVKLDSQSRIGIWMSEDVGKVFTHSILDQNLQKSRNYYENTVNMEGDTQIKFLKYGNLTYIFSLGRKYFELFGVIQAVSTIFCSTNQSLVKQDYQIVFRSTDCKGKYDPNLNQQPLNGIEKFFQMCEVNMNLTFQTKKAYIDSSNVATIVGICVPLLVIILGLIGYACYRYQKEKKEVIKLEKDKKSHYETLSLQEKQ